MQKVSWVTHWHWPWKFIHWIVHGKTNSKLWPFFVESLHGLMNPYHIIFCPYSNFIWPKQNNQIFDFFIWFYLYPYLYFKFASISIFLSFSHLFVCKIIHFLVLLSQSGFPHMTVTLCQLRRIFYGMVPRSDLDQLLASAEVKLRPTSSSFSSNCVCSCLIFPLLNYSLCIFFPHSDKYLYLFFLFLWPTENTCIVRIQWNHYSTLLPWWF